MSSLPPLESASKIFQPCQCLAARRVSIRIEAISAHAVDEAIVRASADEGIATIWDADVLLWLAGALLQNSACGRDESFEVLFFTGRPV